MLRRGKMRRSWVILAGLVIVLGLTGMAGADEVVYYDDGTTQFIDSINRSNIVGVQMAGMEVTVEGTLNNVAFSYTQPLLADTLINQGYVNFPGNFSLLVKGDTYLDKWVVVSFNSNPLYLRSIEFDGFPAKVVFDSIFDAVEGSQGSGLGRFTGVNDVPFPIQATYRDRVAFEGKEPVGDLYRYLDVFVNKTITGVGSLNLFIADTDSFNPVAPPVPVPASLFLLGTGLLVLTGFRRQIKKSKSAIVVN
jgi:hypothetical protein